MSVTLLRAAAAVAAAAAGLALWRMLTRQARVDAPRGGWTGGARAAPLESVAGEEDPGAALDDWAPLRSVHR